MSKKQNFYKIILLTGATGKLGKAILASNQKGRYFLTPTRKEMDITKPEDVERYIKNNRIDAIIHCAAMSKVSESEKNPESALNVNAMGTSNLVKNVIQNTGIRFIYISTDYVYPGISGQYKETDPAIPFTVYGWTKLGGECAVKVLKNHCIIRTTFLDPENIPFDTAPSDAYRSTIPIRELSDAIMFLLDSEFVGIVNVGQERKSMYEIWKNYKPSTRAVTLSESSKGEIFARDSSLDINLWKSLMYAIKLR